MVWFAVDLVLEGLVFVERYYANIGIHTERDTHRETHSRSCRMRLTQSLTHIRVTHQSSTTLSHTYLACKSYTTLWQNQLVGRDSRFAVKRNATAAGRTRQHNHPSTRGRSTAKHTMRELSLWYVSFGVRVSLPVPLRCHTCRGIYWQSSSLPFSMLIHRSSFYFLNCDCYCIQTDNGLLSCCLCLPWLILLLLPSAFAIFYLLEQNATTFFHITHSASPGWRCSSWTGGTCMFSNCDASRGPTQCNWAKACVCPQNFCSLACRCGMLSFERTIS